MKLTATDKPQLGEQQDTVMWSPAYKLKDYIGKNSVTFDLEVLSREAKSPIKKVIIQKIQNVSRFRVGLVINSPKVPDVILEESSHEEHTKNRR